MVVPPQYHGPVVSGMLPLLDDCLADQHAMPRVSQLYVSDIAKLRAKQSAEECEASRVKLSVPAARYITFEIYPSVAPLSGASNRPTLILEARLATNSYFI